MKNFLLVLLWIPSSLLTILLALLCFYYFDNLNNTTLALAKQADNIAFKDQLEFYAASSQVLGSFSSNIKAADARPGIVKQYLEKYSSPLLPYSDLIIQLSDKYGLDFRLILAISQCESNLCKKIPAGSFNCWGFENGSTRFISWEQALEQVAKTLKENYIDYGLTTPEKIMPKYAPPSVDKGGPWARCVNTFMEELR
jgi:hypothetical protein